MPIPLPITDRTALLQSRIKDLKPQIAGTALEKHIARLYGELSDRGVVFHPPCYLSDQWGCPSGVPVIGIPFYLADANLHAIEAELGGGAESEKEIMMYLRHEAGHAFNYAYKLYERPEWRQLFGDYSKAYNDEYRPRPFSRNYVVHLSGWYAQKHPDEDFAETFAVWLTPDIDWKKRYAREGALRKLAYVEATMANLATKPPIVNSAQRDLDVEDMQETVEDYYHRRELDEKIELHIDDRLDQDLYHLFERPAADPTVALPLASTLIRSAQPLLVQAVTEYSGVNRGIVKSLVHHLAHRALALALTVEVQRTQEYILQTTALVTTLAMNYLHTEQFFDPGDPTSPTLQKP